VSTVPFPTPIAPEDLRFSPANPDFTSDVNHMLDDTGADLVGLDSDASDLIDAGAALAAGLPDAENALADAATASAAVGDSGLDDDALTLPGSIAVGDQILSDYGQLAPGTVEAPAAPTTGGAAPDVDFSQYALDYGPYTVSGYINTGYPDVNTYFEWWTYMEGQPWPNMYHVDQVQYVAGRKDVWQNAAPAESGAAIKLSVSRAFPGMHQVVYKIFVREKSAWALIGFEALITAP
jgi:hypothetical protein